MNDRFDCPGPVRPEIDHLVEFRPTDCMGQLPDDPYERIRKALACGMAAWPGGLEGIETGTALARRAFRQIQRGTRRREPGDDPQCTIGP